jgi:hypothetical protein
LLLGQALSSHASFDLPTPTLTAVVCLKAVTVFVVGPKNIADFGSDLVSG